MSGFGLMGKVCKFLDWKYREREIDVSGKAKTFRALSASIAALTVMVSIAASSGTTMAQSSTPAATMSGPIATAQPGQNVSFVLLPKQVGNPVFAQADSGAQEAAAELKSTGKYQFVGPSSADVQQQIPFIQSATTQGANVIA